MLRSKNIVVTGANRGIGEAIVEECAKQGANVWACARTASAKFEEALAHLAIEHGVQCYPVYFDMTDYAAMKEAVAIMRKEAKAIDGLVNNVGMIAEPKPFVMMDVETIRKVMEVNFVASAVLTQYIVRIMQRKGSGSIVNIASVAALDGFPGQFEYAASKGAVIGGTHELSAELGPSGIRVNSIAPGVIDTDMGNAIDVTLMEGVIGRSALGKPGKPKDIAALTAYLLSDDSDFVTGQVIRVDGGLGIPGAKRF